MFQSMLLVWLQWIHVKSHYWLSAVFENMSNLAPRGTVATTLKSIAFLNMGFLLITFGNGYGDDRVY